MEHCFQANELPIMRSTIHNMSALTAVLQIVYSAHSCLHLAAASITAPRRVGTLPVIALVSDAAVLHSAFFSSVRGRADLAAVCGPLARHGQQLPRGCVAVCRGDQRSLPKQAAQLAAQQVLCAKTKRFENQQEVTVHIIEDFQYRLATSCNTRLG